MSALETPPIGAMEEEPSTPIVPLALAVEDGEEANVKLAVELVSMDLSIQSLALAIVMEDGLELLATNVTTTPDLADPMEPSILPNALATVIQLMNTLESFVTLALPILTVVTE